MTAPNRILRLGLLGNAIFSAISGVILLVASTPLSAILGVPRSGALTAIGGLLLLFAAHLVIAAKRQRTWLGEVYYFCALDFLWILGSVTLLWSGAFPLTKAGVWVVCAVALAVADFMILQFLGAIKLREKRS